MKKDTKTPFFLKENNCVDGKHYYALVEAEIVKVYDKDNKIQMDVKMPEELDGIAAWIPYAQEFVSSIQPVAVYEYISE